MFGGMKTSRSEQCTSDLLLDAWLSEELGAAQAAELSAHEEACSRCHARRVELARDRERFVNEAAALPAWLDTPRAKKPRTLGYALAAVCAAAAGVLAFIALPTSEPSVRTKGGDHLSFYVKRGSEVRRGMANERVRPGDKLRFSYTAGSERYLAILSLDGARQASVYYPDSAQATRVEPGVNVALPSAVELDAVLGEERVIALFCDRPLPVAELRAELQGKLALQPPQGCTLDQLVLMKVAP